MCCVRVCVEFGEGGCGAAKRAINSTFTPECYRDMRAVNDRCPGVLAREVTARGNLRGRANKTDKSSVVKAFNKGLLSCILTKSAC